TAENPAQRSDVRRYFGNLDDAITAYDQGLVTLHTYVWLRYDGAVDANEPEAEALVLSDETVEIPLKGESPVVYSGDVLMAGAPVAGAIATEITGQVLRVTPDAVLMRPAISLEEAGEPESEVTKLYYGSKSNDPLRLVRESADGEMLSQYIRTTPGRIIFNHKIQEAIAQ
ncbi:MAG: hypothetical protein AAGF75_01745, partial [Cyanobacteria bacterium P01_H01_bin.130]